MGLSPGWFSQQLPAPSRPEVMVGSSGGHHWIMMGSGVILEPALQPFVSGWAPGCLQGVRGCERWMLQQCYPPGTLNLES